MYKTVSSEFFRSLAEGYPWNAQRNEKIKCSSISFEDFSLPATKRDSRLESFDLLERLAYLRR